MERDDLTVDGIIDMAFDVVMDEYGYTINRKIKLYPIPDFVFLPKFQQQSEMMTHPKVFGKSHRPKRK